MITLSLAAASCNSPGKTRTDYQLWAADVAAAGITRAQDKRTLSATDPTFSTFVCMTDADFDNLIHCGMATDQTQKSPILCTWKRWLGNAAAAAIERPEEGLKMPVTDPAFSSFLCLTNADFTALLSTGL